MKKSLCVLGLSFCFFAAQSHAQTLESPSSDGGGEGVGVEFDLEGAYIGNGDVERGGRRRINNFDERNFLARFIVLPRTPVGYLRLGGEYEIYDFDISDRAQVANRLQSIAFVVGLDTKFSDSFLIRFEAKPGFYSANDIEGKDFNVPFVLGGTYLYSTSLQFVLGMGVDYEGKYPVLPGGGIRWKFASQWVLNAVLPQPRLEYELNSKVLLYAGAGIRSKNFRVDDNFVGGPRDRGDLNNAVLTYTEVRTGAGLVWNVSDACKLTVEAGYLPYRDFDYHRASIRYKSDGGAPYGSISFHAAF